MMDRNLKTVNIRGEKKILHEAEQKKNGAWKYYFSKVGKHSIDK